MHSAFGTMVRLRFVRRLVMGLAKLVAPYPIANAIVVGSSEKIHRRIGLTYTVNLPETTKTTYKYI